MDIVVVVAAAAAAAGTEKEEKGEEEGEEKVFDKNFVFGDNYNYIVFGVVSEEF